MKTIDELNNKWWYRLIKIMFYLSLIVSIFYPILLINNKYGLHIDYVRCSSTEVVSFNQFNKSSLYKDFLYSKFTNDDKFALNNEIKELCSNFFIEKIIMTTGPSDNVVFSERDWGLTFVYSLLSILSTLFVFELARRVLYYVVLGSINPKKDSTNGN
jgi:hypothetical protein